MVVLFSSLDRKLLRDLWRMRGQAFAVGIIIACGVGILIMALGALASLQTSQDTYYERYRFADVFADVKRAPLRTVEDIRNIAGIRSVDTRISRVVTLDIDHLQEPANAQLVSLPEEGEPLLNAVLLYEGRWPDTTRPNEAVISKAFADANDYGIGDEIKAVINGQARQIEVSGIGDSPEFVFTLGPGALLPDEQRFGVFWMRRSSLEDAFDLDGAFNSLIASIETGANAQTFIDDLDRVLAPYGAIGAFGREDQLSHAFLSSEMQQLRAMASVIPPVFLIVSALLIHAILARLIAVERQQIGLLKAFGYNQREIAIHYIKLALALAVGGVLVGYGLGSVLARTVTYLYSDTFRFPEITMRIEPAAYVISAGAASVAAVAGALDSVFKAVRLKAAEAMVPPPPPVYRQGYLQKSILGRALDEPTRMIVRHIGRWPTRAAMTVFGIAASMGLLVGTLFSFDSIDALIDKHFYRTNAYDAVVSFTDIQPGTAMSELVALPGVLSVEPARDIFVRFRNGHIIERTAVMGLKKDGALRNLFSDDSSKLVLPEQGLTLSTQLASMLDVGLGDEVVMEVLVGRRPVVTMLVTALVDEDVGALAFMEVTSVNRILGEGPTLTGAYLKLDPSLTDAFSTAVLDRPEIASVSLQSAAMDTFESTLNETIIIMMTIYSLIGGSIAAGVVYNAARISLTERGRELASLRVLGFTKSETAYILIGELAFLALVAIPIGSLLGIAFANLIVAGMSTELYRVPYALTPYTQGMAGLIVLTAAALAAVLVVQRVRKLDLIEVLKTRE